MTLTAEAIYPINLTQSNNNLHYNGSSSYLFVNDTKIYQFKAKDSEIKDYALFLGNISKYFTNNNIKKSRIKKIRKIFLFILILLIITIFYIFINV